MTRHRVLAFKLSCRLKLDSYESSYCRSFWGILLRGFLSLAIITSVLQLCIRRRRYYAIKYGNEYG